LLARAGWASAATALAAGVCAVALPDAAGVLLLAALVSIGTAALLLGAPAARAGTHFGLTVGLLVVAAAAGVALALTVDAVIAVGVVYVAFVITLVMRAR
jgi:hypothetical protein